MSASPSSRYTKWLMAGPGPLVLCIVAAFYDNQWLFFLVSAITTLGVLSSLAIFSPALRRRCRLLLKGAVPGYISIAPGLGIIAICSVTQHYATCAAWMWLTISEVALRESTPTPCQGCSKSPNLP